MPTYDYACTACGHTFEQVQSMTAERLVKCPACGKNKLERLVSGGTGFILKGAGFWRNDSKSRKSGGAGPSASSAGNTTNNSEGSKAPPSAGSPAESKPDSKGESKAEPKSQSKPAAKTDSKPDSKPNPNPDNKKKPDRQ